MGLRRPPAPEIGEPDIDPELLSLFIGTFKKVSLTLRNPFVDQIQTFQTLQPCSWVCRQIVGWERVRFGSVQVLGPWGSTKRH